MIWKYGIIPFEDRALAVGIFNIVTFPDSSKRIVENSGGDIEVKIVEEVDWKVQQDNFLDAQWTVFFNINPQYTDDFIKSALNGHDLPLKPSII